MYDRGYERIIESSAATVSSVTPQWIPVDSASIEAVAYEDGELLVAFRDGGTYVYVAVPQSVFTALLQADSHGRFVNEQVKPSYAYRRL